MFQGLGYENIGEAIGAGTGLSCQLHPHLCQALSCCVSARPPEKLLRKKSPRLLPATPLHEKARPALIPASPRWLQPPPHPEGLPPTCGAGTLLCPRHNKGRVTRHPPRVSQLQVAGLGLEHRLPACPLSANPDQPQGLRLVPVL